jgi:hypothetical protein
MQRRSLQKASQSLRAAPTFRVVTSNPSAQLSKMAVSPRRKAASLTSVATSPSGGRYRRKLSRNVESSKGPRPTKIEARRGMHLAWVALHCHEIEQQTLTATIEADCPVPLDHHQGRRPSRPTGAKW